jgi:23S rRNA (adenine2030-N6)-methyltransferase
MFSYRHAFHAGNHADVLKHLVLIHSIRYLQEKDGGLMLIDTHAGAGLYTLREGYATVSQEALTGIDRIIGNQDPTLILSTVLIRRIELIFTLGHHSSWQSYCGPKIVYASLSSIRVILTYCNKTSSHFI